MDFTAYITLCLILVAPSCHSTREERAATAWATVSAADSAYLALLQCGPMATAEWYSGSIISDSKVLTYSTYDNTDIVVFAGFITFDTSKAAPEGAQVREVTEVDKHKGKKELKILTVNETWILNDNVASVELHLGGKRGLPTEECTVLGFKQTAKIIEAQTMKQDVGGEAQCKEQERQNVAAILYSKAAADQKLGALDLGGPAVCGNKKQWGISMQFKQADSSATPKTLDCNLYINIVAYREWIEGAMTEKPGENEGSNNSTASSGYSIHSYLNKYSNWKVLGFLVPIIVTFLQY